MAHRPVLLAAAVAASGAFVAPVAAEIAVAEDQTVCYGLAYPWSEVDAEPARRAMQMQLWLTNLGGDLYFGFVVAFIDRPGLVFNAGGLCHPRDDGYMCAHDGDGGVIYVAASEDNGVTIRGGEYGMQVYSSAFDSLIPPEDYSEYHPDGIESFRTSDAMPVHRLVPLPPEVCH